MISPTVATAGTDYGFWRATWQQVGAGTSDFLMLPSGMTKISAAVFPAVGQTARVEYSVSDPALVLAGTADCPAAWWFQPNDAGSASAGHCESGNDDGEWDASCGEYASALGRVET